MSGDEALDRAAGRAYGVLQEYALQKGDAALRTELELLEQELRDVRTQRRRKQILKRIAVLKGATPAPPHRWGRYAQFR